MQCLNHFDQPIVGTCRVCGGGLCNDCFGRYSDPLCARDALEQNRQLRTSINRGFVIAGTLAALGFVLTISSGPGLAIGGAYVFGASYFGWRVVRHLLSHLNFILIMPLMGWVVYSILLISMALLLGTIVAPFEIWRSLRTLSAIRMEASLSEVVA